MRSGRACKPFKGKCPIPYPVDRVEANRSAGCHVVQASCPNTGPTEGSARRSGDHDEPMPKYTRRTAVQDYLTLYPDIAERWVNRCQACGRVGFKPEMPDDAGGAHYLKREIAPLELDVRGLCDVCSGVALDDGRPSDQVKGHS